jgi:hypothetical protein
MADRHAHWWGITPHTNHTWAPTGPDPETLVREARAALIEIERADWGERFLPKSDLHTWLRVLDDPICLLETLAALPQTLVHTGSQILDPLDDIAAGGIKRDPFAIGPAPHELAISYSAWRWALARLPLSLAQMRNIYLQRLNEHLAAPFDRYGFDLGFDAALAWRFATFWPAAIIKQRLCLQAALHHLRATVIEPAHASLRRCLA